MTTPKVFDWSAFMLKVSRYINNPGLDGFADFMLDATDRVTYGDMARWSGCSVSTVGRRVALARILKLKQSQKPNVVSIRKTVDVQVKPACEHITPHEAAVEIHRLVHASGGRISQADIGRIWGYSPGWLGQVLARA